MPKMKTHKSGAKRYKVTGSGKIMRRHAGIGHLLSNKSASRKRKLFGEGEIAASQMDLVTKELPYLKYSR
ncbi:MAG: 50S ribosomal protein L35 [Candidatus Gastranaerophilales bacterium]|nr:50S ribosomal protein L35 [Candidatus Gastranaerophilales bacterium]